MASVSIASPRNIYRKIPNTILGKEVNFQLLTATAFQSYSRLYLGGRIPPPPRQDVKPNPKAWFTLMR